MASTVRRFFGDEEDHGTFKRLVGDYNKELCGAAVYHWAWMGTHHDDEFMRRQLTVPVSGSEALLTPFAEAANNSAWLLKRTRP